jgi:hypothetical protein
MATMTGYRTHQAAAGGSRAACRRARRARSACSSSHWVPMTEVMACFSRGAHRGSPVARRQACGRIRARDHGTLLSCSEGYVCRGPEECPSSDDTVLPDPLPLAGRLGRPRGESEARRSATHANTESVGTKSSGRIPALRVGRPRRIRRSARRSLDTTQQLPLPLRRLAARWPCATSRARSDTYGSAFFILPHITDLFTKGDMA